MSGAYSRCGIEDAFPEDFEKVVEGHAAVLFPPAKGKKERQASDEPKDAEERSIFYNKAQVVNRDLSVCILSTFAQQRISEPAKKGGTKEGITVLEALSATGLRAIRYWKEVEGIRKIIANDLDSDAVENIRTNVAYNGIDSGCIVPNHDDAVVLMQRLGWDPNTVPYTVVAELDGPKGKSTLPLLQKEKVDVVDLDPYGSASPFLDSAIQCIREGGLMAVTCTDSAILCGNYPDTCHGKYSSTCLRIDSCHEFAVRIVLAALERTANKHRKYIHPLLSLHIDFYVRVFVRVFTQPAEVKLSCCKLASVIQCTNCPAFSLLPLGEGKVGKNEKKRAREEKKEVAPEGAVRFQDCKGILNGVHPAVVRVANCSMNEENIRCKFCNCRMAIGGPIYAAPSHDPFFLKLLQETVQRKAQQEKLTAVDRISGLVAAALDELPFCPLFYVVPEVSSALGMPCIPVPHLVGALGRLGYSCSQVHCHPAGLKTDAPSSVLFGLLTYHKQQTHGATAATTKREKEKSSSKALVSCPPVEGDFSYDPKFDFRSSKTGVAKFIPNEPYWGPQRRHVGVSKD